MHTHTHTHSDTDIYRNEGTFSRAKVEAEQQQQRPAWRIRNLHYNEPTVATTTVTQHPLPSPARPSVYLPPLKYSSHQLRS